MLDFLRGKTSLQLGVRFSQLRVFGEKKARTFLQDVYIMREKSKDIAKTNYELGLMHMQKGNLYDAVLRFRITLWVKPDFAPAYYNLGRVLLMQGRGDKAQEAFAKALALQPDYLEVRYMMASLTKNKAAVTDIPLSIIEDYFDDLAPRYNAEFVDHLHYVGHISLVDAVLDVLENKTLAVDVLDLGCGTGLCGALLRERLTVNSLTGVDISEKMLREARVLKHKGKPVYDYLKHKDMKLFLEKSERKYDVITASLSVNFIGDVAPFLAACKNALRPGGVLAFSTEESPDKDITLNDTMQNFCHSLEYIREQSLAAGFKELSLKKTMLLENMLAVQSVLQNTP